MYLSNSFQIFPHIKYVMDKFRHKLPKDDLKKFAKEIGKKLVASDFKNNRVDDPTKISPKQEKKVRKYVKEFFDKAVAKKAEHDKKRRAERSSSSHKSASKEASNGLGNVSIVSPKEEVKVEESDGMEMSDDELDSTSGQLAPSIPATPGGSFGEDNLKRKLDDISHNEEYDSTPCDTPFKKVKDEEDRSGEPSPPPPPPPPPAGDMPEVSGEMEMTEEDLEMAEQEAALMRENEEALMKENEEAMKEALARGEGVESQLPMNIDQVDKKAGGPNGIKGKDFEMEDTNGNGVKPESSGKNTDGMDDKENIDKMQQERKHVLGH
jgi:hypothetical protein